MTELRGFEAGMATLQNKWGKDDRKQSHRKRDSIGTIRIGWEEGNGQEVTVRHKPPLQRGKKAAFGWFEEFTIEWTETFISKN